MSGVVVKAGTVGLLLLGGVMIAAGQYDAGAVPDNEACVIRGAGCSEWRKDGGCSALDGTTGLCCIYDDYDDMGKPGQSKIISTNSCGGQCGTYDSIGNCDS
jgi:hypothetical protein